MPKPRLPLICGTQRAYHAHRELGQTPDALCRAANRRGRTVTSADLVLSLPAECRCSACCCEFGGEHCRQRGCTYCLTTTGRQEETRG